MPCQFLVLLEDAWELRLRVLLVGRLSENSEAAFYDIETCRLIWSLEVQVSATLHWMIIVRERKRKELINYSRNSLPIILRKRKAVATVHIACIRDSGVGMIGNSNGRCASCGGVFTL